LAFLQGSERGFLAENRLVVHGIDRNKLQGRETQLTTVLSQLEGVSSVTLSDGLPTSPITSEYYFRWPNGYEETGFPPTLGSGFNVVSTLGLNLIAGRDFETHFASDWIHTVNTSQAEVASDEQPQAMSLIVTESMAKRAGYMHVEEVVGLKVVGLYENIEATIVGVVGDLKVGGAKDDRVPMSFSCGLFYEQNLNVVIKGHDDKVRFLLPHITAILRDFDLSYEPHITAMQQDVEYNFKEEAALSTLITFFSVLAVGLSCFGILGLSAFQVLRKQKEIAIRKVLGSSKLAVLNLIAKEFMLLTFIALCAAFPIFYIGSQRWLETFNEHVGVMWWVFPVAALCVLMMTWGTVVVMAYRAASVRPALILRNE